MDPDSVNFILLNTENLGISTEVILGIIIFVLLFFTALISGSEVALFSLSSKDINYIIDSLIINDYLNIGAYDISSITIFGGDEMRVDIVLQITDNTQITYNPQITDNTQITDSSNNIYLLYQ